MEFRILIANLDEVEDFYGECENRVDVDGTDKWKKFSNWIDLPVNPSEIGRIVYQTCGHSSRNGYQILTIDCPLKEISVDFDNIYRTDVSIKEAYDVIEEEVGVENVDDDFIDVINALTSEGYELSEAIDEFDKVEIIGCYDEEEFGCMYAEDNYRYDYELEDYIDFCRLGEDILGRKSFYVFYDDRLFVID